MSARDVVPAWLARPRLWAPGACALLVISSLLPGALAATLPAGAPPVPASGLQPAARTNSGLPLPATSPAGYLSNWSKGPVVAVDPTNPLVLEMLTTNLLFNLSSTPNGSGAAVLWGSLDGGVTWTRQPLPPAANWSDPASPVCGQRFDGTGALAFSPNGTSFFAGETVRWGAGSNCVVPLSEGGIYVSSRAPGGSEWRAPFAVSGDAAGANASAPSLTVDPVTGAVLVAFSAVVSGTPFLELSNVSRSTRSPAVTVQLGSTSGVSIVAPTTPAGSVELVWESAGGIYAAWSLDGGANVSVPIVVASGLTPPPFSPSSYSPNDVDATLDPAGGHIYAVWVNGSGSATHPSEVLVASAAVDSSAWGAPSVVVAYGGGGGVVAFQPSLGFAANGTLAVLWLEGASTGAAGSGYYSVVGTFLDPWGSIRSLSAPFPVDPVLSQVWFPWNDTEFQTRSIGPRPAVAGSGTGILSSWTDLRSPAANACGGCLSDPARNASVYTGQFEPLSIGTNVPAVNVSVDGVLSGNGRVAVSGRNVSVFGAERGAELTAAASPMTSVNGTTWYFAAWIGSDLSLMPTVTETILGALNLTACYVPVRSSPCTLPGAPGLLQGTVTPTSATGTLDGAAFPLVAGTYAVLLAPGFHLLRVQAPGYVTFVGQVLIVAGTATNQSIALSPNGRISGFAFPVNGNLTIGGIPIPIGASGTFGLNVTPGTYEVRMTAPEFAGYDDPAVVVGPGENVALYLALEGTARLFGLVSPGLANLSIGTVLIPHPTGNYSIVVPADVPFEILASARGFLPLAVGPIDLQVGQAEEENISLSVAPGWIEGTITPNGSVVTVNGTIVDEETLYAGGFNISEAVGWYYVNASAPGFLSASVIITVGAGTVTWSNLSLVPAPGPQMGPPLTFLSLLRGLIIDGALLGGLAAVFVVARSRRLSPSGGGTVR